MTFDSAGDDARPLEIDLLVIHPTMTVAELSAGLDMVAHFSHRAGDQRQTPNGKTLPGVYSDTRWRHVASYELGSQHFAHQLVRFVACLKSKRDFLARIVNEGGTCSLNLSFLENYYSDALPPSLLADIADMKLELGIQIYAHPPYRAEEE